MLDPRGQLLRATVGFAGRSSLLTAQKAAAFVQSLVGRQSERLVLLSEHAVENLRRFGRAHISVTLMARTTVPSTRPMRGVGSSPTLKRITASPNSGAPVTESVADYRDTIHAAIRATTKLSIPL